MHSRNRYDYLFVNKLSYACSFTTEMIYFPDCLDNHGRLMKIGEAQVMGDNVTIVSCDMFDGEIRKVISKGK